MKRWLPFFLWLIAVTANAQTYKIQKAWAFKTESMPGMVMQDDNGNAINPTPIVERFIYIETNYKSQPKINAVLYNSTIYTATLTAVKEAKHQAGVTYNGNKPFFITPKKGNTLWRISMQPANSTPAPLSIKIISIKGKLGNSSFKQVLYTEIQLTGPEYQ